MKKSVILAMVLLLTGCAPAKKKEEGHSSMVITAGGEIISAYRDGENVTDERKVLEEQTEVAVSKFLNREREELEFDVFCMLEMDGNRFDLRG